MMKLIVNLSLAFFLSVSFAKAQTYEFSKKNETYTELNSSVKIFGDTLWDEESYLLPMDFTFKFMNKNYQQLRMDGNGMLTFGHDTSKAYFIGFGADLSAKGTTTSLSPISFQTDTFNGFRILKIEYKNARFFSDAAVSNINFQIWLYEYYNAIEVHIGACNTINDSLAYDGNKGPTIGIFKPDTMLTTFLYSYALTGATASPVAKAIDYANRETLEGTPSSGTVYRFETERYLDIPFVKDKKVDIEYYPNPASNNLHINSKFPITKMMLLSTLGNEVYKQPIVGETSLDINLSALKLQSGIYILSVETEGRVLNNRLIIN
jgi:hypothetical protein